MYMCIRVGYVFNPFQLSPQFHSYTDSETKRTYWAKVALKVRVKPGDYQVLPQTVQPTADGVKIDGNFDNTELEWATVQPKAVIIVGLLVKLEPRYPGT